MSSDVSGVTSSYGSVATSTGSSTIGVPGGVLDKNAFLQLLVAQMQYQDPLQPMDSTAFVAQLAQFTTLEQVMNLASAVAQMQTEEAGMYATSLLGKEVQIANGSGATTSGTVTGIQWQNGSPYLQVNGELVDPANVVAVQLPQSQEA
ncbi:MAG: flagellar biosynthesis protein FlgD [Thermoflavifilum sp.]|nr:flagellar biosynthesis protein FlgD [Thermoflavifilum sp.]MCL6513384.1 flagellar hook capping protein [Alicyclobacillus sp.]